MTITQFLSMPVTMPETCSILLQRPYCAIHQAGHTDGHCIRSMGDDSHSKFLRHQPGNFARLRTFSVCLPLWNDTHLSAHAVEQRFRHNRDQPWWHHMSSSMKELKRMAINKTSQIFQITSIWNKCAWRNLNKGLHCRSLSPSMLSVHVS